MEIILKKQAWLVDIRDLMGATPLHCAVTASEEVLSCVKVLVSFGCDINAQNATGDTSLHWLITDNSFGGHPCMETRDRLTAPVVKYLADAGAEIYVQNDRGLTPLKSALLKGLVFSALALIYARPDLSSIDSPLQSILHPAVDRSMSLVVKRILAPDVTLSTSCRALDISATGLLSHAVTVTLDDLERPGLSDHNRRICMRMMTGIMLGYTDFHIAR
jgi:hypothetical protein